MTIPPPPASPPALHAVLSSARNPAADAAARALIDQVAAYLSRRARTVAGPAPRPCRPDCHAAAWGLLAQLESAGIEARALPAHADALKDALG